MRSYDSHNPNNKSAPRRSRPRPSVTPAQAREAILMNQLRKERDIGSPVMARVLPPIPEDSRELKGNVEGLLAHALGEPLPEAVAPALLDDEKRSLVIQRTGVQLSELGITGSVLDEAHERIARVQDEAAAVINNMETMGGVPAPE